MSLKKKNIIKKIIGNNLNFHFLIKGFSNVYQLNNDQWQALRSNAKFLIRDKEKVKFLKNYVEFFEDLVQLFSVSSGNGREGPHDDMIPFINDLKSEYEREKTPGIIADFQSKFKSKIWQVTRNDIAKSDEFVNNFISLDSSIQNISNYRGLKNLGNSNKR